MFDKTKTFDNTSVKYLQQSLLRKVRATLCARCVQHVVVAHAGGFWRDCAAGGDHGRARRRSSGVPLPRCPRSRCRRVPGPHGMPRRCVCACCRTCGSCSHARAMRALRRKLCSVVAQRGCVCCRQIEGTANLLEACATMGVQRLVLVSDALVTFNGNALSGADESTPLATTFAYVAGWVRRLVVLAGVAHCMLQGCAPRVACTSRDHGTGGCEVWCVCMSRFVGRSCRLLGGHSSHLPRRSFGMQAPACARAAFGPTVCSVHASPTSFSVSPARHRYVCVVAGS